MHNYAQARQNMVDCQLATNGIMAPEVMAAFRTVPRECFLPENKKGTAYSDEDLVLEKGAFFMEPVVHARMVQVAAPERSQSVLNIGDLTGYSSAILSSLVSTVVVLESRNGALDKARDVWDTLGCCNMAVVPGKEAEGNAEHAPYDLVFINGAVVEVPDILLAQLNEGGRLVTVIKKAGTTVGVITVMEKARDGHFSTRRFFDAATPYAKGFEPVTGFVF
ncbi:MAG: protein-L-isoaspartate O-methyltransferase [Alphaproteobacteria bacterium CG_4_9_14_3_um_filter_47_13]|nr:MAG: protein-L-isoaspartate O-methyltransferase [Alphaproteobacteria bacterium CG_4_9_14_3_um_filter_47_13]